MPSLLDQGSSLKTRTCDEEPGSKQSKEHASGVGRYFPPEAIDEIYDFARDARPAPIYTSHSEIIVVYELLIIRDGWKDKLKRLVNDWVADEANIKRAEKCVGRRSGLEVDKLVRAYGLFRLRERSHRDGWISVLDGLGDDSRKSQTTVYVALTDLSPENGFFMFLKKGEDVCIDSQASVKFPPPGGGLGISFVLDL